MRLRTFSVAVVLSAASTVFGAAAGMAQSPGSSCTAGATVQYPPSGCGLQLTSSAGARGSSVGVTGQGFAPSADVGLEFRSQPVSIGTAKASANGAFTTTITIPASAEPGAHTIAAIGRNADGSNRELTAQYTVIASTANAVVDKSGTLPVTGGGEAPSMAVAGVGLVAIGGAAVRAARIRRRRTA